MKSLTVIIFILSAIICKGQSLDRLDSLLNSLNNADLYTSPIIYNPWEPKKMGINKDSARINKRLFIVSSLDQDIQQLAEKYPKKILVEKLVPLLQDTTRDFYANALLYDLLENRKLGKLLFMKREEWVSNGRKIFDTQHWQEYAQKQIYIY